MQNVECPQNTAVIMAVKAATQNVSNG